MRPFALSDRVVVDLTEVESVRWSRRRSLSHDACVIVTMRNGHEHGQWWEMGASPPTDVVAANDRAAEALFREVVAAWTEGHQLITPNA